MKAVIIHVEGSQAFINGLKKAIDADETIDIKVPGGIYTVQLDAIEVDE